VDNVRVVRQRIKHNRPQKAVDLRMALTGKGGTVCTTKSPDLVAFEKASAQGVPVYDVEDRRAAKA
jgi:hypothetical protein